MRELHPSRWATIVVLICVTMWASDARRAEAQATGWRPSRPARAAKPAAPSATRIDPFALPPAAPIQRTSHNDYLSDVQLGPGEILVSGPSYEQLPPGAIMQPGAEPMPVPNGARRRFVPGAPMVGPGDYVESYGNTAEFFPGDAGMGGCDGCDSCGPDGNCDMWVEPNCCEESFDACMPCTQWCWSQDLTFFGGVEGFKGPLDQGLNGNFGYHVGGNYALPFWCRYGVGLQAGFQINGANLSGNPQAGVNDVRTQTFATAGFFHRATNDAWGWNWGVAYDYLSDDYYDSTMYSQIRVELSRRFYCVHEIGFLGMTGVRNDNFTDPNTGDDTAATVLDQYLGFYRHRFTRGGEGRILAGASGNSDAIIGADAIVPFSESFALETSGVYVIPANGDDNASGQEAWNIQTSIVWYPGRTGLVAVNSRYRPLFNVANAGTLIPIR